MSTNMRGYAAAAGVLLVLVGYGFAQEATRVATGLEVTLKGPMMTEASCLANPPAGADKTVVLIVVEGTPEVAATVDAIMKENWPGEGSIDGDHARKLDDEWVKRLKYYITPNEQTLGKEKDYRWRNPVKAVTGVVSEKDGKRWITPSKITPAGPLTYPEKMFQPRKPFVMPGKDPLILKVSDTLSLKCILVSRGKFLVGSHYHTYQRGSGWCRYDDDFPHMWTLTKPYYLAEIPVTQEMYESVMGENPSDQKDPQLPVTRVSATNLAKFCQILSEKNHRTVRLPTVAENTNVGLVGTSDPPFKQKLRDLYIDAPEGSYGKSLRPVRTTPPNPWGFYDLYKPIAAGAYEMTSDRPAFLRKDEVDRAYPDRSGKNRAGVAGGGGEFIKDGTWPGYFLTKSRVAVEATPEEIAEMEKAEKR